MPPKKQQQQQQQQQPGSQGRGRGRGASAPRQQPQQPAAAAPAWPARAQQQQQPQQQGGNGAGRGRGRGRGRGAVEAQPAQPGPATQQQQHPARQTPQQQQQQQQPAQPTPSAHAPAARAGPPATPAAQQGEVMMRRVQQRLATAPYLTQSFVRRPGFGTVGTPTRVIANHFKFTKMPNTTIYHYDVVVDPEPSKMVMSKVWEQWEMTHGAQARAVVVFDGVKNAYSPHDVPAGEVTVTLPPNPDAPPTRRTPKDFKVKLTKVNELNLAVLDAFIQGKVGIDEHILTCIQAMDIAFRHSASKTMVASGRNFFVRGSNPASLSGGLELWSGLFQSVRPGNGVMTLNVDTAYTAFYKAMSVVKFAHEALNQQRLPANQELMFRDRSKLEKLLRQVIVIATHRRDSKLRHRVLRLSREGADRCMFAYTPEGGAPQQLSVAQYFKIKYGILLQYPKLPCLVVGTPQKSVMLPMECATIAPDQKFRGKLDEYQTSDVIKIAAKKPNERQAQILRLFGTLQLNSNKYLQAFGIQVDAQPMVIDARILDTPALTVGGNRVNRPRDGAWNFVNMRVANPARISALGVLSFCDPRRASQDQVADWMDGFFETAEGMGLGFNPNKGTKDNYPIQFARGNPEGVEAALRAIYQATGNTFKQDPELIVCLLPAKSTAMYAEVKRIGDTVLGVPTQCLVLNKVQRANAQYWANVVLKVNTKVSGAYINFRLAQSRFFTESTMLVGADVTHPAPGIHQASIACMVGSLAGNSADRYATVTRQQPHSRQEELGDCKGMFAQLLRAYHAKNNKSFPKRILFYRDGVSEGQFAAVQQTEVKAIKDVLENAGARDTKLTFVVVQKRHHTRFFATNLARDTDRSGNLKAGTVVDRGVTDPVNFDFFLQSQAGLQGTSRPTRYFVLHDDVGWTADDLQMFTYHLCYTYARCTRSVSVAPPAYYAHLACFRARHHATGGIDASETTSVYSTGSGGAGEPAAIPMVSTKLKDSMYFM
ncbi:hypothetical protein AMAG_17442 [Allomyces macrogynus ATCC 38327]|uniref:Piwi domain-containing protein n=1 Tax=Allomyces macrogynus (strain ATCC 38327) TaxID=578462 RepID=A0A0L0TEV1_ALLM3|nr:hypothetical protein AMAG_17442 [Allomyces macrogynus ATCC 38327]|eukprot:KNE73272.1 hypothetical protein AMAG_17442 [Allomyces macrogynus ATCC 38327]